MMSKFVMFGLMAVATLLMSADGAFAGGGTAQDSREKENTKDSKADTKEENGKIEPRGSFKFTYPVTSEEPHPDLVVLVRPGAFNPPTTIGELKAAVNVEPGGEYIVKKLKPGFYTVWLGRASSLKMLSEYPNNSEITFEQRSYFLIDDDSIMFSGKEQWHFLIGPTTGLTPAPAEDVTTLPAGN